MDDLTRRVIAYQTTGVDRTALCNYVATVTYYYPLRNGRCTEDDCGDFLLFFRRRIGGVLERFSYQGMPFDAYLLATLRWQLRTYIRRRDRSKAHTKATLRPAILTESMHAGEANSAVGQTEPRYHCRRFKPLIPAVSHSNRRRLLIILLKACLHLGEHDLPAAARCTGRDPAWIRECWLRLRVRMLCRQGRREELIGRRNRLFVLLHRAHYQLWESNDPHERQRLLDNAALIRQRLRRVRHKLARVPRSPTNLDIAEVTGIPKGTVDSTLYYARKRANELQSAQLSRILPDVSEATAEVQKR